jgi:hypothetical protein
MSPIYPVTSDHPLCGTWVAESDDTDDYVRAAYTISVACERFEVTGIDCSDGEAFVISEIAYDGEWLRFSSIMPSTGRVGRNCMRVMRSGKMEFRFTFTETEYWVRKHFPLTVVTSQAV